MNDTIEIGIDEGIEQINPIVQGWMERQVKVQEIIKTIELGDKLVVNKEKILSLLRFVILTLDLAIEGDEEAIRLLKIEAESKRINNKQTIKQ